MSGASKAMAEVSEPYLRDQLEKRREELASVCSEEPATAPFLELLQEVDSAIHRIDEGVFGVCEVCDGTVEKERLIADPLVRVCLDCLTDVEKRALEQDLELASRIQRTLLPAASTRFRDWQIHYEYRSAGMVSGDYCDLILPANENGNLIFLLGDVAGKGVAASLLMTHLHAMFRSLAGVDLELEKLLEHANRVFCESTTAGQYATLICGRAGRSGEIEIGSAGHFPALLVAKDGVKKIHSTGLPLGMFSTSRYTTQRVHLEPGDCLLLYTDGILEARDAEGSEYGIARLSRSAGERHGWVPQELLAACLKDVGKFSPGAHLADDQTLMVVHRADSTGAFLPH
jgi:sigma-B regulation protein RsbU (phosphoserine phosphatase)